MFLDTLNKEGITIIESNNIEFNPHLHEALSLEENEDYESGYIIETVKIGYRINDKIIRPAIVKVAK